MHLVMALLMKNITKQLRQPAAWDPPAAYSRAAHGIAHAAAATACGEHHII
jgi:hypothetical protein